MLLFYGDLRFARIYLLPSRQKRVFFSSCFSPPRGRGVNGTGLSRSWLQGWKNKQDMLAALTVAEDSFPVVLGHPFLLEGEVEVHVHGLGVPDVEVAIGLWRETRPNLAARVCWRRRREQVRPKEEREDYVHSPSGLTSQQPIFLFPQSRIMLDFACLLSLSVSNMSSASRLPWYAAVLDALLDRRWYILITDRVTQTTFLDK